MNSTLLELYKSDKSPLVYYLFILFKKNQPLSKGESVTILLCYLFFLLRMCFEFDLIVKLKLETLLFAKFVLKGKPFLYPTEVQKESVLLLFFCLFFFHSMRSQQMNIQYLSSSSSGKRGEYLIL